MLVTSSWLWDRLLGLVVCAWLANQLLPLKKLLADKASTALKAAKQPTRLGYNQAIFVDLLQVARLQAVARGVKEESIATVQYCTVCGPRWFYSHRRDGQQRGAQFSFIGG